MGFFLPPSATSVRKNRSAIYTTTRVNVQIYVFCCIWQSGWNFSMQSVYYWGIVPNKIVRTHMCTYVSLSLRLQGGAKKQGQPISLQIFWKLHDRITWKWVNFCNIICWTQSLTFCLKKFIALWRHLAKTPLLSFIHTVQNNIDLSITQQLCFR